MKIFIIYLLTFIALTSCISQESPLETFSRDYAVVNPGDLVVTNYYGDSAILLDADGNFKKMLYNVENNQEQVLGVTWNEFTNEIVLTINGTPDRVVAISPLDGNSRVAVQSNLYAGNAFGVAVDSDGGYLLVESHQVEKFTVLGTRVNDGIYPTGTLFNYLAQINSRKAGGFVVCSYHTGLKVATYDKDAVQLNNAVSGIAATTRSYGCNETSSGDIIVSWNGTTDTVALLDSTLSTVKATFNDSTILSSPIGIGIKSNGNFLVADSVFHYIVELDPELNFVRSLGGGILNYPWQVIEIPEY